MVGYASRLGSTRDMATRIADTIRTRGSEVDLRSVDDILDVDRCDAMVFGSGVYDGSWTAEATALMRRHAAVLARKPLWLFSVGLFGDSHPIVGGLHATSRLALSSPAAAVQRAASDGRGDRWRGPLP